MPYVEDPGTGLITWVDDMSVPVPGAESTPGLPPGFFQGPITTPVSIPAGRPGQGQPLPTVAQPTPVVQPASVPAGRPGPDQPKGRTVVREWGERQANGRVKVYRTYSDGTTEVAREESFEKNQGLPEKPAAAGGGGGGATQGGYSTRNAGESDAAYAGRLYSETIQRLGIPYLGVADPRLDDIYRTATGITNIDSIHRLEQFNRDYYAKNKISTNEHLFNQNIGAEKSNQPVGAVGTNWWELGLPGPPATTTPPVAPTPTPTPTPVTPEVNPFTQGITNFQQLNELISKGEVPAVAENLISTAEGAGGRFAIPYRDFLKNQAQNALALRTLQSVVNPEESNDYARYLGDYYQALGQGGVDVDQDALNLLGQAQTRLQAGNLGATQEAFAKDVGAQYSGILAALNRSLAPTLQRSVQRGLGEAYQRYQGLGPEAPSTFLQFASDLGYGRR